MQRPDGTNEQQICFEHNICNYSTSEVAQALYLAYRRGRKDVLKELGGTTFKVSFQNFDFLLQDCDNRSIKLTAKDLHNDTLDDHL